MNILIDGNILLDVLQNRKPFVDDSLSIWNLCESGDLTGFVSAITFANLVYIMRKELDPDRIAFVYHSLQKVFQIVDLKAAYIQASAEAKWPDFEDAVQFFTAKKMQANYIVTRNLKDYEKSNIPTIEPGELLTILFSKET